MRITVPAAFLKPGDELSMRELDLQGVLTNVTTELDVTTLEAGQHTAWVPANQPITAHRPKTKPPKI